MSLDAALNKLDAVIARRLERVACFRAVVTAVDGGLISLRRVGATTADSQTYPSLARLRLVVDDEVLVARLNGAPVVIDRINRSAAATPSLALGAAAGATATGLITGSDRSGLLQITPSGAGIAAGSLATITFARALGSANLAFVMTPASSAARSLGMVLGTSTKTATSVLIATSVALTAGSNYQWNYIAEEHQP